MIILDFIVIILAIGSLMVDIFLGALGIGAIVFAWPVLKYLLIGIAALTVAGGPVVWIGSAIAKFVDGDIIEGIWYLLFGWIPGGLITIAGVFAMNLLLNGI